MTAVEWFVKGLQERGVEWVATLCGHGLDPFDYVCRQAGLRLVDTRNEQTAAYMAEVYGRLTGRPGVVFPGGGRRWSKGPPTISAAPAPTTSTTAMAPRPGAVVRAAMMVMGNPYALESNRRDHAIKEFSE